MDSKQALIVLITLLLKSHLQLEQSFQDAILTKWEAGEATSHSKEGIARSKRLQTTVSDMLLEIQLPI